MDAVDNKEEERTPLRHLLRALRSRNYRLFVAGQGVSLVGTWMQLVAMNWLVYRLTGSAILLGVLGFASQIPILFISPLSGVLADRCNRRHLLLATQSLAMVQAICLAFVVLSGIVQVWQIILLSLILGIVNAFDIPIRQSFVVEMVEHREDLGNAIALNSSLVNGARLIGPSIAGLLVASVGEGICFVLNAISYLAVIMALAAMRLPPCSRTGLPEEIICTNSMKVSAMPIPLARSKAFCSCLRWSASWECLIPFWCPCSQKKYCMAAQILSGFS